MQSRHTLALTPPAPCNPSLAIAACRAGAVGVLDLEYTADVGAGWAALADLERFTASPFGVKLGRLNGAAVARLLSECPDRLTTVVLAGGAHPDLAAWAAAFRGNGITVLLEAISVEEGARGRSLGVDGLILKGHEAGGRVGSETSFILLQRWAAEVKNTDAEPLPVYVQGGVGLHTASACVAGGATGVVLDAQLLLTRESPLSEENRKRLVACDGSETLVLGERLGQAVRLYHRPKLAVAEELQQEEDRLLASAQPAADRLQAWRDTVAKLAGAGPDAGPWLLGQDAAFARPLADRFVTTAGVIQAITGRVRTQLDAARRLRPLAEGSALAKRHGTRYPLLQGPMTRVSDTAAFADAVADAGGLPFLALALMRKDEATKLLQEASQRLQGKPWGVGLLGFMPPEIRNEQLAAVRQYPPPFALIAGGQPAQAKELEKDGIPTYLHVPSPGLLKMFLKDGVRKFVFEGRECGGHVGPRTSFVLWETMTEALLEHLGPSGRGDDLHVVFAGGVHDALSAAMVAALAAPLAERGVAVGALMGTAYLFTREAVEAGAIVPRFQEEALRCRDTVLLQTGPGHAIRCIKTPYQELFEQEKARLQREGKSAEEITRALEWMNVGRLRVASKGVDRAKDGPAKFVTVSEQEQLERGMYMIGQVAALRDRVVGMAELHADVCAGGARLLDAAREPVIEVMPERLRPCDVAIVGMACFYPKASDVWNYWENVLNKVDAVTEVPASHWDWRLYYDANPQAPDKIISRWGGFLDDQPFDPLTFGITPKSMASIEPLQMFLLESVRRALADAGYDRRPFNRERTAAILGIGGGGNPLAVAYGFRTCLPMFGTVPGLPVTADELFEKTSAFLPEWTEDSFPGILLNVAVGRVANRFDFGGANYAIDAACGSSLASVQACLTELETGTSDVAIAMGADMVQTPYAYMAFSKTHALSAKGRCKPFDANADGIVLSEGVAAVVLKRLADAERDGDQIYAVIKGVGASSDGRDKGLTAPRAKGQLLALRRAYAKSGLSPARVELIEAHGTGTVVGDQTEVEALGQVMAEAGADPQSCALGSVKSMIGHSKCAAGIAGLIKTVMAVRHKVLPPTLVEKPNLKYDWAHGPLYLNTEPRPWVHAAGEPRVAGVSAFGFGGTNFHVVLEEYAGGYVPSDEAALLLFRKATRAELLASVERCHAALTQGATPELGDLAASLWKDASQELRIADCELQMGRQGETATQPGTSVISNSQSPISNSPTLAVVAADLADLREKLTAALKALRSAEATFTDPRGVYFAERPAVQGGKVAFLFPGQGSQYTDMLAQAGIAFDEVRSAFDRAESVLAGALEKPLGRFVYPSSAFTPERQKENQQALTRTDVAQPAIGAAGVGMFHLLANLGLRPDFLAGHSYGEYVALWAAGVMNEADLFRLSHRRGHVIREAADRMPGGMAALEAEAAKVEALVAGLADVTVANVNAPRQTVVSGTDAGLTAALERAQQQGVRGQRIPVACGFHSPLVAAAREPLAEAIAAATFAAPRRPVYANATGLPYPNESAEIAATLADHLVSPVRFQTQVEAMYEAGARVFVEVGPGGVLTGLVNQTLADRPKLAVASDLKGRPGLVQLQHVLGQLLAAGVPVQLDRLYRGRALRPLNLNRLKEETAKPGPTPTTFLVNSVRSRPWNGPEPRLLGQTTHQNAPAAPAKPAPVKEVAQPAARQAAPNVPPHPTAAPSVPPADPRRSSPVTQPAPLPTASTNGSHPPAPVNGTYAGADEATAVMLGFQNLMARFLDTQKSVMTAYLNGGADAAAVPGNGVAHAPALPPASLNGHGHDANGHSYPAVPPAPAVEPGPALSPSPEPVAEQVEAPAPAAEPAKDEPAVTMDRGWLSGQLLHLVSDRTGYPREMLGVDLDLEADLGIDSIKRIEILGALAEMIGLGGDAGAGSNLEMEKLTTIRTLRGILDYLEANLGGDKAEESKPSRNGTAAPAGGQLEVQRALVRLVDAPLPALGSPALPSGAILFTDDERGVAQELAGRLADFGQKTVLVRSGAGFEADAAGVFRADLTNPGQVERLLEAVREQVGPVGGLVHLLPLAEPAADEAPLARAEREVKSLYLLARGLGDDLREAGRQGGAFLIAATALGGTLGLGDGPLPDDFFAGQGGVVGFTKCVAQEWPEVLVRAVDLDASRPADELAECLADELGDPQGPVEVGRRGERRVTWEPVAAPADKSQPAAEPLAPGATVLVTGGARGITAAVALELGKRYRPNLILAGRSPLPEPEPADTAGLTAAAELKSALIARFQREGREATPAAVESAYRRLLQDREISGNLEAIRATGAQVHYHAVDVRDEQAFGALLDEIEQQFGGLDGVIHGAGVIEDRLLRDKTPESFDRVFRTKVQSALLLARRLKPERLKFLVFFSSIASRYGNKGQSDYAAANEVLSKFAWGLDRQWPCRVVSVAWGPWAGVGMVADLEKHLTQRGLKLISPQEGPAFVVEELLYGRKGESEVIVAGGAENVARPGRPQDAAAEAALAR